MLWYKEIMDLELCNFVSNCSIKHVFSEKEESLQEEDQLYGPTELNYAQKICLVMISPSKRYQ